MCRSGMVIRVMDYPVENANPGVQRHLRRGLDMFSGVPLPCPVDRHRPVPGGHERAVHTDAHLHIRGINPVGYSPIMSPLSPTRPGRRGGGEAPTTSLSLVENRLTPGVI